MATDPSGNLVVSTPVGSYTDQAPVSYQDSAGARQEVASAFRVSKTAPGVFTYGFSLGAYDGIRPLVIDPAMLVYAGFIGGSGLDVGQGIAVDGSGAAYVTGFTDSNEITFPETVGPDLSFNGGFDAFVAKIRGASAADLSVTKTDSPDPVAGGRDPHLVPSGPGRRGRSP